MQERTWTTSDVEAINGKPCRITINGRRHYTCPLAGGVAPSVTTILSETSSEQSKKKLEMWAKRNPGVKEKAAERGTAIHFGCEQYLRGNKNPDIPEEYMNYWEGMPGILDQFDLSQLVWSEVPMLPEHQFTMGGDDIARVWGCDDKGRGWCGAPDLICVTKKGQLTLGDFKTSFKPYHRSWPKGLAKGSPAWREGVAGVTKFKKTIKQLAAYDLGIQQTLGITVDQAAILVSTPERTQIFKISRRFLDRLHGDWLDLVDEYYSDVERCPHFSDD